MDGIEAAAHKTGGSSFDITANNSAVPMNVAICFVFIKCFLFTLREDIKTR